MARPLTRTDRIAARAEPELAAALERARALLEAAEPGREVTGADVVRLLLWEALRARGLDRQAATVAA